MKRMLLLALVCALAITIAVPSSVMAHSGISTIISITAEQTGDNTFELTIIETNDSADWKGQPELSNVWIDLQPLGYALVKGDGYYVGGDTNDDGILDRYESWVWVVPVTVTTPTTFVAIGHGITYDGWDITFDPDAAWPWPNGKIAHDAEERAEVTVTPSDGDGEGFTPGFWRNHLEEWPATGYSPSDIFSAVFGVGPDDTLGEYKVGTIWAKGGGENVLLRHGTAALLNAAHPNVNYAYTVAEVIAMVQDAYATGDYGTAADAFTAENELEGDITS